jgi:hypothetical protein
MVLASIFGGLLEGIEGLFNGVLEGFEYLGELLVHGFEAIGGYVVYGGLTIYNGLESVFELALEAASAVLPGLPEVVRPPEFVEAINWFFPLATLLGVAATLLAGYVTWMGVRWVYKKYGAL